MKGVVLSFPARSRTRQKLSTASFEVFFKRYLSFVIYMLFFTAGIVWGAVTSLKADSQFLLNMDFLFSTNLSSRLTAGIPASFMAHFASNFVFWVAVVLLGLSPWGVGALPLIIAFKGFGTGLSAAYLISNFGVKGLGFYLVVVMPGTFIFTLVLLFMCSESGRVSLRISRFIFGKGDTAVPLCGYVKSYLLRCTYFLFMSAVGAVCDMLLWSFVSKLFF